MSSRKTLHTLPAALLAALLLICAGCGPKGPQVERLTMSVAELTVQQGHGSNISVQISPAEAAEVPVEWTSSAPAVATVQDRGAGAARVTGVAPGNATITATAGGKTATCRVTVSEPDVMAESVLLDQTSLNLVVGDKTVLNATISPSNTTDKSLFWISSAPKVVEVEKLAQDRAQLTALGAGRATVMARTNNGMLASCDIVVLPATDPAAFAKGADISWVTEMERDGKTFPGGDLFTILSGIGMNAVRLRVFVDGPEQWCETEDVVAKAKRAKESNMAVMIDFHYSDFFCDPSRQTTPASWNGLSLDEMAQKVAAHTKETLTALKNAGVEPLWVQVGNETRNGMLWDTGRLWTNSGDIPGGYAAFAKLFNAGYDAAKEVFRGICVMPHLNNAYEDNAWWFDKMKAAGMKFDAIALSHYPMADGVANWQNMNSKAIAQIKALNTKYSVPVYVSEIGIRLTYWDGSREVDNTATAKSCMDAFMAEAKAATACKGVFYWEPQVYGGWKPSIYSNVSQYVPGQTSWNAYEMGAFTKSGEPSAALDCFKN